MEKRVILSVLAICTLLISCQNGKESSQKAEVPKPNPSVSNPAAVEPEKLINPNLVSIEELQRHFGTEIAKEIVNKRPLLKTADFLAILHEKMSPEAIEEICRYSYLPVNLNTATREEILSIPGVGEKMAHEFEEYRPYVSIEQFRREIGKYVKKAQVSAYERYVYVPVDLNKGSKAEFLAIPGVGKKMLHEFEEYRPYANIEQFRREIGKYVDDNELARLERYIIL